MCLKTIYKDCPKNLRHILKIILFKPDKHKISPLQYIKLGLKNFCQEFRESLSLEATQDTQVIQLNKENEKEFCQEVPNQS